MRLDIWRAFTIVMHPIVFLISILVAGCAIYQPQTTDIPLISNKGDIRIDGGVSSIPSGQATISYGLTNAITVQTYGSLGSDESRYFQGALGAYKNLNQSNVLEIYGGSGLGHGAYYRSDEPGDITGNYQLYFTQVNYGKLKPDAKNMEYGVGIKTGFMQSQMQDWQYSGGNPAQGYSTDYVDNSYLLEPTVFMRFGKENLKFNVKLTGCWIHKFTNKEVDYPYRKVNLGLSLNYRIKKKQP